MMKRIAVVALALAAPALAGPDRDLGATVNANIARQTIDPDPHYAGTRGPGADGRRTADALIRYETGRLKPLVRTNGKVELGNQGGAQDAPTVSIPLINTGSPN